MQFLWKYVEDLVGKGLEWTIIAELLFYAALVLVPMAMPLAVLLASIMTFGNLGESNELFAMKSGGISLYKIMMPLFILCIGITVASFLFSDRILPYTNLKMRSLLMSIQQQRPEINIQNGIFSEPVEYFSIKADKDSKTGNLTNLLVYDHRKQNRNTNVTTAQKGSIKVTEDKSFLVLDLSNGYRFEEISDRRQETKQYQRSNFKHQTVYIPLDGLGLDRDNEDFFKNNYDMINNRQIVQTVDSIRNNLNTRFYNSCSNIVNYYSFKMLHHKERLLSGIEKKDSILPATLDFDSIYNSLSSGSKKLILEKTIEDCKSVKMNLEITNEERISNLRWIARHEIEWHRKYAYAVACLLFFVVGAAIGSIVRKGGFGIPVIISMVLFLLYYIISIAFENTVRELVLSSELGMWVATYILIPIAIILTVKAANESLGMKGIKNKIRKIIQKRKY